MTFELATYGLIVGLMYGVSRWKCVKALYISLLTAMVAGRVVWGIAQALLLGLGETDLPFTRSSPALCLQRSPASSCS